MSAVWEIRVFGYVAALAGRLQRRTYTFIERSFEEASSEAKRLAKLDGLANPQVFAATRMREIPDGLQRPDRISSGSARPSSYPPPGVVIPLKPRLA